jgi:hypothetical protein
VGLAALIADAPPPPLAPVPGILEDVAAISASSIWALGSRCVHGCSTPAEADRKLILRRDATGWSMVASTSPGQNAILHGVSAVPGGNAWAAGASCTSRCGTTAAVHRTLILRWDGTSWSRMASSQNQNAVLYSVSAGPGASAWAAGYSSAPAVAQTLILHWDGTNWSRTASPSPGQNAVLHGVSAGPGGSAWAAGTSCTSGCGTAAAVHRTLILHWDGTSWSRTASPSPGRGAFLNGVSAGPGGSAWAAGYSCKSGCGTPSEVDRSLILRWDGTAWLAG